MYILSTVETENTNSASSRTLARHSCGQHEGRERKKQKKKNCGLSSTRLPWNTSKFNGSPTCNSNVLSRKSMCGLLRNTAMTCHRTTHKPARLNCTRQHSSVLPVIDCSGTLHTLAENEFLGTPNSETDPRQKTWSVTQMDSKQQLSPPLMIGCLRVGMNG